MCSSPKASYRKSQPQHRPQLSSGQQAEYAARANAAWERREALRQQPSQNTIITRAPEPSPSFLERLLQLLYKPDNR